MINRIRQSALCLKIKETLPKALIILAAVAFFFPLFELLFIIPMRLFTEPGPPVGREIYSDVDKYMQLNNYMQELMTERYTNFFPDELYDADGAVYYHDYWYSDTELNFIIYLEQSYDSARQFELELRRIKGFEHSAVKDCGDVSYIAFDMPERERIEEYLEYSGKAAGLSGEELYAVPRRHSYNFSAIRVDTVAMHITYLLSYEYDTRYPKAVLTKFLETYLDETG